MKYTDLQGLERQELKNRLLTMREELFLMRMKHSLGQLNNPLQIRYLRRDVARVRTALKVAESQTVPSKAKSKGKNAKTAKGK